MGIAADRVATGGEGRGIGRERGGFAELLVEPARMASFFISGGSPFDARAQRESRNKTSAE
jgi:hypothetical protein